MTDEEDKWQQYAHALMAILTDKRETVKTFVRTRAYAGKTPDKMFGFHLLMFTVKTKPAFLTHLSRITHPDKNGGVDIGQLQSKIGQIKLLQEELPKTDDMPLECITNAFAAAEAKEAAEAKAAAEAEAKAAAEATAAAKAKAAAKANAAAKAKAKAQRSTTTAAKKKHRKSKPSTKVNKRKAPSDLNPTRQKTMKRLHDSFQKFKKGKKGGFIGGLLLSLLNGPITSTRYDSFRQQYPNFANKNTFKAVRKMIHTNARPWYHTQQQHHGKIIDGSNEEELVFNPDSEWEEMVQQAAENAQMTDYVTLE